jgi:hypothetical protein
MAHIIPIKMTDADAVQIVRGCAKNSTKVSFCEHAMQQMRKRHISTTQVMDCLAKGQIYEPVCRDVRGDWKLTLEHVACATVIRVAVAIKYNSSGERIVVITAF